MYLSRLIMNPRSRAVRRDLSNLQQLHRTIMSAFPKAPNGSPRALFNVLFRVDSNPHIGTITLYVQSGEKPNWSRLASDYLEASLRDNPACKPVDLQYNNLKSGMVLGFRLLANPTKKIDTKTGTDGNHRNGRRVELRSESEQIAWLERKAATGGFEILPLRDNPDLPDVRVRNLGKLTGGNLTFASILFDGNLRIKEPEQFLNTLKIGIGPGKAYGFGLLSLAPSRG